MYVHDDEVPKFITVEIEFSDTNAKNDFKRLTKTNPVQNPALDFELIFPLPLNLSIAERCQWRNQVWGSDGMGCEGEVMVENEFTISYELTTKTGMPTEFVKNLYLYARIKKIRIHCIDARDIVYATRSRTAPCKRRGCNHDWCEMVFQEWESKYNWSELPHPLFEVTGMLDWIKDSFQPLDDRETGRIYHQILREVVSFRKLAESELVAEAKEEFERQVGLCDNPYLQTMVMLNDYETSPGYVFKSGRSLIYRDAIDYYLKKTQPLREIPRFPKRLNKK